jgi:hypothetical protein
VPFSISENQARVLWFDRQSLAFMHVEQQEIETLVGLPKNIQLEREKGLRSKRSGKVKTE